MGSARRLNGGSGSITAGWRVDETLARHPSTGPIFLQGGPLYVAQQAQPYATYPGLTLAEYATINALAIESLLASLNAVADAEEFARNAASHSRPDRGESVRCERAPPVGSIGYTGSYREPSEDIVDVLMVSVLESRGPD